MSCNNLSPVMSRLAPCSELTCACRLRIELLFWQGRSQKQKVGGGLFTGGCRAREKGKKGKEVEGMKTAETDRPIISMLLMFARVGFPAWQGI